MTAFAFLFLFTISDYGTTYDAQGELHLGDRYFYFGSSWK
jgi:hypothetical protein